MRGCGGPARVAGCGEAGLPRRCPAACPRGASRFCLLAFIAAKEVSVLERGEKARAPSCGIRSGGQLSGRHYRDTLSRAEMRLTFAGLGNNAVI